MAEEPKDRFNYGDNMNGSYSNYINKDYIIRFENARIAKDEQDVVEFKAFMTAFKDLFKPEWNEETVFGRTEPIGIYKGISRRLSFGFDAPADSVIEGKDNLSKTEDLVKMLYPTYHQPGTDPNYRILSQAPLIRLSFVNIINDHKHQKGLLGYITSFDYDLSFGKDIGVFDGEEKFLTPRLISFNIDFTVLHEIPLGYGIKEGENFMDGKFASDKGWLYGVDEGEIAKATKQAQRARAESEESSRQAAFAGAVISEADQRAILDQAQATVNTEMDAINNPEKAKKEQREQKKAENKAARQQRRADRKLDRQDLLYSAGLRKNPANRSTVVEIDAPSSGWSDEDQAAYNKAIGQQRGSEAIRQQQKQKRYDEIAERGSTSGTPVDSGLEGLPPRGRR